MKLCQEDARAMVWGDSEDFEEVEVNVVDNTRWSIVKDGIFRHLPTGKFYSTSWSVGATEYQDEQPFEYEEEVELQEVVPKQVTVTQYVPV